VGTLGKACWTTIYGHAHYSSNLSLHGLLALAGQPVIISRASSSNRLEERQCGPGWPRFRAKLSSLGCSGGIPADGGSPADLPAPARINPPAIQALHAFAQADDLKINLTITTRQVGQNTFQLRLSSNGAEVVSVKQALPAFHPRFGSHRPIEGELIAKGRHVHHKGTYFSMPGSWQVQAVVRRTNKFDAYATSTSGCPKPGEANPAEATPRFTGALFLVIAFDRDAAGNCPADPAGDRFAAGNPAIYVNAVLGVYS